MAPNSDGHLKAKKSKSKSKRLLSFDEQANDSVIAIISNGNSNLETADVQLRDTMIDRCLLTCGKYSQIFGSVSCHTQCTYLILTMS